MARLDNRSTNQPVTMLLTPDIDAAVSPTPVFDTRDYDPGYVIIISSPNPGGGASVTFTIETSDSPTTGFTAVDDSLLIGGNNNIVIDSTANSSSGDVAFSRGVIDNKRYVRVAFLELSAVGGLPTAVWLNGALVVAPSEIAEGTDISV
jgi:hypothetical protein